MAAWISAKTLNFCVMSKDQIIGMRELERWPNNGGLVMLTRAAICAGPAGSTGDKNNELRPSQTARNHQGEASQDDDSPSRLREDQIATAELQWPARLGQVRFVWFIWFLWSIWLVWSIRFISFSQTHETDRIDQINETDRTDQMNKTGWRPVSASC